MKGSTTWYNIMGLTAIATQHLGIATRNLSSPNIILKKSQTNIMGLAQIAAARIGFGLTITKAKSKLIAGNAKTGKGS